jgi:hypothetical protein
VAVCSYKAVTISGMTKETSKMLKPPIPLTAFQQAIWDSAVKACQASSKLDETGDKYWLLKSRDTQLAFAKLLTQATVIDRSIERMFDELMADAIVKL